MQIRYFVISLAAALLGFSGSLNATGITGSSGGTTQNSGSTQSDDSDSGSCSNAGYNALMNFNYDSGFPLRIMGNTTVAGSDVPHPPGATNQSTCKCGQEPYAVYGYTRGMWLPTRFVEVVRRADCSPVYGASVKPMLSQMARLSGTLKPVTLQTAGEGSAGRYDTSFRHFHSWEFPFNPYNWSPRCFHKGGNLETSITQPTWSAKDPVFMNLLYPEWMAIGNVVNNPLFDIPAHTASCVANTTGIGWGPADDAAYWLGGCMGNNLPAAGSMSAEKNSIIGTSTILNRSILLSHRTGGFASVSTVGDKALCTPVPVPLPSKSEFKATMLFPYPEAQSASSSAAGSGIDNGTLFGQLSGEVANFFNLNSKGAHRLGASDFSWAIGRSDQALNDNDSDAVYLLWRWVDCCEFN